MIDSLVEALVGLLPGPPWFWFLLVFMLVAAFVIYVAVEGF
jgi:hypothetical protein